MEDGAPERPSHPHGGSNGRVLFAAVFLAVQGALIVTAERREAGAFGFRMFAESSTIRLSLFREVGGQRIPVPGGEWIARSSDGRLHRCSWYERVPVPHWVFDQEMTAPYGARTQLGRLQRALEDLAAHVPNDDESRRFVLEVAVRRNGRESVTHTLTSPARTPSLPGDP